MTKFSKSTLWLALFCFTISFATLSFANLSYAQNKENISFKTRLTNANPANQVVAFIRKPGNIKDLAFLRITLPAPTSGCVKIDNPFYEVEVKPPYLNIYLYAPELKAKSLPQYAHFQCSASASTPYADIPLGKDHLVENEIKQVVIIDNISNVRKAFDVNVNDMFLSLQNNDGQVTSDYIFKPQQIHNRVDPLTHWFYPEGTVIVYAPMAKQDMNIRQELHDFAVQEGLIPLQDVMTSFKSPLKSPDHLYFIDMDEDYETLEAQKIGALTYEKTVYGLVGDETVTDELAVYMRKPGMYE